MRIGVVTLALLWSGDAAGQSKQACVDAAHQAQELRDRGRYVAARRDLLLCAQEACPSPVARSCATWLVELEPSIPTVVFVAREDNRDLAAVRVRVDGELVAERLDGRPVMIDPGEHVVLFERDGRPPEEERVLVTAGEKNRRVVLAFRPRVAVPAPVAPDRPPIEKPATGALREVTALALLAGSVVAGGLGVFFDLRSRAEASDAAALRAPLGPGGCLTPSPDCARLADAVSGQNAMADRAVVSFAAAGVLAAASLATFLLWPRSNARVRSSFPRVDVGFTF
jgi:hypothetical protein